ncbi:RNA-dependent RNA polymerase [Shayang Fly Virus 3]|uniref:Replicase n=1 Tax=Shayang Fly Virus 3 TaxID=1608067 RepID=A0A0B5KRI0_9RHAB|nr:RNA-dependent RNA polymerase [Shayang Fly Virus 3]AJG39131.1 RNA-dependent RNA polymerase [Shayang Fly Virus 3]
MAGFYAYDEEDQIKSPKIPSLLSSHLDSPLRIYQLDYIKRHLNRIVKEDPSSSNKQHPPTCRFIIQDFKEIHQLTKCSIFTIMSSSTLLDLHSKVLPSEEMRSGMHLLERSLIAALRNLELQIPSIVHTSESLSEVPIKDSLAKLLANKATLAKNLPYIIKHHFFWYNLLYKAVIITGLTDKEPGVNQDLQNMGLNWKLINPARNMYAISFENLDMIVSRNCFYIKNKDGNHILGTREHLLLICDLFLQRFNLLLSGFLARTIGFIHYLTDMELFKIFQWGDKLLYQFQDLSYDILSKWEPLCLGIMMNNVPDPVVDNSQFFNTIVNDILNDFKNAKYQLEPSMVWLHQFLSSLFKKSSHKLSQAFGLFRIWGHPNVDSRDGIIKLKQIACQKKVPNFKKVREISCVFMEQFSLNYRAKTGMWPKMNVSKLPPYNLIRKAYETNSTLSLVSKYYRRLDWSYVHFEQTFEIMDKLNISELISDKAMSLGIQELYSQVQKYQNIGLATEKAVIIQWLKSNLNDPIEFLKDINDNGFGLDERVFGVCPKERELKIAARFFGLATLKKRMYIVLTEAMIAEFIVPHFPQITMMDNALTLSKKFFDKTRDMAKHDSLITKRSYNVVTNIDFKKWNTYMRKEETNSIFTSMDNLFGLSHCISRTHEMFEGSYMYLADGTYLPKFEIKDNQISMIEDDYVWRNHYGGIEGLRQKGWTIFTVCILIHAMEVFQVKFSLMGQGDNQVLIVHYMSKLPLIRISQLHEKIINHLESILKLIGPPLKREETWSSSNLFIYGKVMFLNGCPLTMSQKKICRMFPMSNEGFPTIETAISSLSANCSSSCSSDINPIIPFIMYSLWSSIVFQHMLSFSYLGFSVSEELLNSCAVPKVKGAFKTRGKDNHVKIPSSHLKHLRHHNLSYLTILNIFPKILGGFPICLFNQFLIKNFPDPLTEYLATIRIIIPRLTQGELSLMQNVLTIEPNKDVDFEALFANPTGLNLEVPSTPGNTVKSSVTRFLKIAPWINNCYVKEFLELNNLNQTEFAKALGTLRPLNPIIGHAMMEATLIGRARQVVDQLDKTSTLIKVAAKNGDDLLGRVRISERNYILNVLICLTSKRSYAIQTNICSRIEAHNLRVMTWKESSITGVTVPYPIEIFSIEAGLDCHLHSNPQHGYILMKQTASPHNLDWWKGDIIGDAVPYLGSKTMDKVKTYGKQIAKSTIPLLRQTLILQSLIGWATERQSNLASCLEFMLAAVTDLPSSLVNPGDSEISGSVEHRLTTTSIDRGGKVELLFTFATYLTLSTDTLISYAKGTVNVNLHFQASLSYLVSIFSLLRSMGLGLKVDCYHGHQDCPDCICEINEQKMDLQEFDWSQLIHSRPDSQFCWVSKEKLLKEADRNLVAYPEFPSDHELTLDPEWVQYRACRAAAKEAMIKIRQISIEIGDGKLPSRGGWTFPVAWVFKLDPKLFFFCFYIEFFNFFLFRQFEDRMKNCRFQDLLKLFIRFITNLESTYLGIFSSWFQNNYFMDYISGEPFFIKPPLNPNLSRSSCGSIFKSLLLTYHLLLDNHQLTFPNLKTWGSITTTGEEAIDSHPILFLFLVFRILDNSDIDAVYNMRCYNALKRILPKFKTNSSCISLNVNLALTSCMEDLQTTLDSNEIKTLVNFFNKVQIYRAFETADGLISNLPQFSLSLQMIDLRRIDVSYVNYAGTSIKIAKSAISELIKEEPIDESDVIPLPEISLQHHSKKPEGFPTTAAYKLLSIVKELSWKSFQVKYAGCFGDGAGGFSKLLMLISDASVFYNSLIYPSIMFANAIGNGYPPCFAGNPGLRKRLIGLKFTFEGASDLTDPFYYTKFKENIKQKLEILICDAEGGGWESSEKAIRMLVNLVCIAIHCSSKLLIFKTYYSNWAGFLLQIRILSDFFISVQIFRSHFSSKFSTEVYIIGEGLKSNIGSPSIIQKETQAYIFVTSNLNYGSSSDLLIKLKSCSAKSPSQSDSLTYSKQLRQVDNKTVDRLTILLLSPTLDKMFNSEFMTFNFPYDYMRDIFSNTHLVKFNKKHHKLTKTNFITKRFSHSIVLGWLTLMAVRDDFTAKNVREVISSGSIIFYHVKDHFWSFWIVPSRILSNVKATYHRLSDLITPSNEKEILSKSAKLRSLFTGRIIFNIPFGSFPMICIGPNPKFHNFSWRGRPMQISSDPIINSKVLKLPDYVNDSGYKSTIEVLQKMELSSIKTLINSGFWDSSDI